MTNDNCIIDLVHTSSRMLYLMKCWSITIYKQFFLTKKYKNTFTPIFLPSPNTLLWPEYTKSIVHKYLTRWRMKKKVSEDPLST
jgi:hypothetical protein